jgi:hypothetical protein
MTLIYLKLIAGAFVGMAFQLWFKSNGLQDTATRANVEYSFAQFISKDKKTIIGTFLAMCLFFLLFGDVIDSVYIHSSDELKPYLWGYIMLSGKTIANMIIMLVCVTVGYMGQDAALRLLGRTSKELKEALENHVPNSQQPN